MSSRDDGDLVKEALWLKRELSSRRLPRNWLS